jgi:hypothetical protein
MKGSVFDNNKIFTIKWGSVRNSSRHDCRELWRQDRRACQPGRDGNRGTEKPARKEPPEEWISLRTTNIIERLNEEFKHRTKRMEVVAGETACYRILPHIFLKMEMHWRSNPVGKVRNNRLYSMNWPMNISHKKVDTTRYSIRTTT